MSKRSIQTVSIAKRDQFKVVLCAQMNNLSHVSKLPQLIAKIFLRLEEKNKTLAKEERICKLF